MAKTFRHVVTVQSRGRNRPYPFPIDMLRYDELHPRSEADSGKITRTFGKYAVPPTDTIEMIDLVREAPKNWTPTSARWESFVYEVVAHTR